MSVLPAFRGNRRRPALELRQWHARVAPEAVLEPLLPIFDPHHHLYGEATDAHHYRRADFEQDLASGHRVFGTLYVEAFESNWRQTGPAEWRSLGEVEAIARASAEPVQTPHGTCVLAAGVLSNVDLTLGDAVAPVIEAHVEAAQGKLRGVRQHATHEPGDVGRHIFNAIPGLLTDPQFRRGLSQLRRYELAFDALVLHTQLPEVADLADAFPNTRIVLNHVGIPLGIGDYAARRAEELARWEQGIRALAQRPNVDVKIGGMGMPLLGFGFEHRDRPAASFELEQAWRPLVETCLQAFGPSRCMLESNFPVDKQSCGYIELWNAFKLITRSMSRDERSALFYRTACRTYRLPTFEAEGDRLSSAD